MKRASLIGHVIELLDEIRASSRPADVVSADFLRNRHYLGSRDRRFLSESVYGILRNSMLLQSSIRMVPAFREKTVIPSLLMYSAYAVRITGEEPGQLIPDISGLWRIYVAEEIGCEDFLHAVASADPLTHAEDDPARCLSLKYSMPVFLVREWLKHLDREAVTRLCESLNEPAPVVLRVNTLKTSREECQSTLLEEGVATNPTRLSPVGLQVERRFNARALRSYRNGYFEIQDEGSQLLSLLLEPDPGMRIVDACAGGGGKTLHLGSLMKNRGQILAIDVQERRLNNIRERLVRAGVGIARVSLAGRDMRAIKEWTATADGVLVDAPCSGSGTFRRNPAAKLTLSETAIHALRETQARVLATYSQLVKPGGRLVYTTCSLYRPENEAIVESFLSLNPDFRLLPALEILRKAGVSIKAGGDYLTLLPHETGTDGFFAAVMTRSFH